MARATDGSRALKLDRVNNIRAMVTGARGLRELKMCRLA